MTQQEFEDKIEAIEATIKKAKEEKRAIEQQYRDENMPYPIGTKVKVTSWRGDVEYGIVMGAELNVLNMVVPIIHKVKKDGTPFKNGKLFLWDCTNVEPITE